MQAHDAFVHPPFDDSSKQIRLLRLAKELTEDNNNFHCELDAFYVHNCPRYVAISYTWGDATKTRPILVNSRSFIVRENCWFVLRQAWDHGGTEYLWIDSICINQRDDEEKSLQVAMMGSIYRNAAFVHVCVGPHRNDSKLLTQEITQFHAGIQTESHENTGRPDMSNWSDHEITAWLYRPRYADFFERMTKDHLEKLVNAMRVLSERSYFRRLWIIQEVYLAATPILCCGDHAVPFSTFVVFAAKLQQYITYKTDVRLTPADDPHASIKFKAWSMELDNLLNSEQDWHTMDLMSFMTYFSDSQCFDPRDHMFGILSLVSWGKEPPVVPDYTADTWQLSYILCSRLPLLSEAARRRHLTVYEKDSLVRPLEGFAHALSAIGIDCRHARVREMVKSRRLAPSLSPSIIARNGCVEDRLTVPISGYCCLRDCEIDDKMLAACFISKPTGQDGRYDSRMHWYDISNGGKTAKKAWQLALQQCAIPHRAVKSGAETFALVPRETKAGDFLVSFYQQNTISGLVLRQTHDNKRRLTIVGQALVDFHFISCSGGVLCPCDVGPEYHGALGPRIMVNFAYDDFLTFTLQDLERDDVRNICTNGEMAIERLGTSVTKADNVWSSYATWHSGPWPETIDDPSDQEPVSQMVLDEVQTGTDLRRDHLGDWCSPKRSWHSVSHCCLLQ